MAEKLMKQMKSLYDHTCQECSKLVTNKYSTSFSLGIRVFDARFRPPIYALYGFVRFADEIVDTFHEFDKKKLLDRFTKDTWQAIEEGISLNPILHAFQEVVNTYHIEKELIEAFLFSMELDLYKHKYTDDLYKSYIYGSAEVVGLMCLRVFCEGDDEKYKQLKKQACSLGSAFQKVNFLRDMASDYEDRGRVYFPGIDFTTFTQEDKEAIEADIQKDFQDAYQGILALPRGARMGVYTAYIYYLKLLEKIRQTPASRVVTERIRVTNRNKIYLLCRSALRNSLNLW